MNLIIPIRPAIYENEARQMSTHSLRHAFATQLLKAHTDLDFVRKVMGHASIKTTQIYLHVLKTDLTKTRSPLDDLNI